MSQTGARNLFIFASIKLASIESPGTDTTIYISNRTAEGLLGLDYKPLIVSLNGISYGMGAYAPQIGNGSITIDDSPHSFGFERRFSDLLERYTVLDQEVAITVERAIDLGEDYNAPGSFSNTIWRGQVTDWRRDSSSQRITLRLRGFELPRTVLTRTVTSNDFPAAPQNALGRVLPLVFGENIEVRPVCVSADGSSSPTWAVMTTLKDEFVAGGVQQYYAKDTDGIYRAVSNAASTSAGVYARGELAPTSSIVNQFDEFANKLSLSTGAIITNARIRCAGSGLGGWLGGEGAIEFNIYLPDERGKPGQKIATATRDKSDFQTQFRGGTGTRFWVEFTFEKPVILGVGRSADFFISVSDISPDDFTTDNRINICGNTTTGNIFYWNSNPQGRRWFRETGAFPAYRIPFDLFGVRFTETTSTATDNAGLSYSKLDGSQYTISGGYAVSPSLTQLDLIVSTHGLRDVSGLVAGVNTLITRPDHAIRTALSIFAANTWNNELVHPTAYTDTLTPLSTSTDRYHRKVGGRSEGRQTAAQIVDEICRSCAIRIAQLPGSGLERLMVYAWGTNRPTRAVLTNRNSRIVTIEQRDSATIVNRATAYAGESLRGLVLETGASENAFKAYVSVSETYNGLDSSATALTSASTTLYGVRPNAATGYRFLGSSARFASDYLCSLFGKPHVYVSLETDFESLTGVGDGLSIFLLPLLAVVEIIHPELPTYFGSSADPGPATFAGSATDPATGQYIVRATTYRGQIEGVEYILNANESPRARFTVRLLTNYPNDPT